MEDSHDLDLTYVTERIIAVSFPANCSEESYLHSLQEVTRMLKCKHGDNYLVSGDDSHGVADGLEVGVPQRTPVRARGVPVPGLHVRNGLGAWNLTHESMGWGLAMSSTLFLLAVTVDCRGGCCLCPALSMASHQLDWLLGK